MALTDYNMVTDGTSNIQHVPINTINLNFTKGSGLEKSNVNINAWFSNNQQTKKNNTNFGLYARKGNTNSQQYFLPEQENTGSLSRRMNSKRTNSGNLGNVSNPTAATISSNRLKSSRGSMIKG